jgi:hypothetical protein
MKASVPSVFNLEASIYQWANEGGSLESNGRPANNVHPYNATGILAQVRDGTAATIS